MIAHASGKLRHVRIPDENGPSQLAPLVAEAFTYAMEKRGYQVQFAIHNAGGVRTSLLPGAVSVADIAGKLLPFAVPIGVYKISGYALAQTLEGAINNALNNGVEGTGSGSYPYTHNLSFDYQADNPIGERIQNLAIFIDGAWHSVNAEGNYYGTSSAYTMKGKEGYHALTAMKGEGKVTNVSMADAFIELLTDKPYLLTQTAQNQAVTQSN